MLSTGIVSFLALSFLSSIFFTRRSFINGAAVSLCALGFLVQVLLEPTCGRAGYDSCWEDCVLPAPDFNHNALFHVMVAVGLLVLGARMVAAPEENMANGQCECLDKHSSAVPTSGDTGSNVSLD